MERADMEFFEGLFRSLEIEMRREFGEVKDEIASARAQITHMSDRLDRIGGLVNGGARAITRLAEWSERTDVTTADVLRRMGEMVQRLRKLEGAKE